MNKEMKEIIGNEYLRSVKYMWWEFQLCTENVIEEGEAKDEFSKRKSVERKNNFHAGKLQVKFVEKTKNNKGWVIEERERGPVICSSGAGTKNQFYQSKDRQITSFSLLFI